MLSKIKREITRSWQEGIYFEPCLDKKTLHINLAIPLRVKIKWPSGKAYEKEYQKIRAAHEMLEELALPNIGYQPHFSCIYKDYRSKTLGKLTQIGELEFRSIEVLADFVGLGDSLRHLQWSLNVTKCFSTTTRGYCLTQIKAMLHTQSPNQWKHIFHTLDHILINGAGSYYENLEVQGLSYSLVQSLRAQVLAHGRLLHAHVDCPKARLRLQKFLQANQRKPTRLGVQFFCHDELVQAKLLLPQAVNLAGLSTYNQSKVIFCFTKEQANYFEDPLFHSQGFSIFFGTSGSLKELISRHRAHITELHIWPKLGKEGFLDLIAVRKLFPDTTLVGHDLLEDALEKAPMQHENPLNECESRMLSQEERVLYAKCQNLRSPIKLSQFLPSAIRNSILPPKLKLAS